MKLILKREGEKFNLTATNALGYQVFLDASHSIGGGKYAFRPMELLPAGIAGCGAGDILNILYKQKQFIETFEIDVDAGRYTNHTPSVFENITLNILAKGMVSENKLSRAISLTRDKYCSLYHTLKHTSTITYRL